MSEEAEEIVVMRRIKETPTKDRCTIVFECNLRKYSANPFHAVTPFGSVVIVSTGDEITRLQNECDESESVADELRTSLTTARARIVGLEGELAVKDAALKPFVDFTRLETMHGETIGHRDITDGELVIVHAGDLKMCIWTVGDLRRAAAAYKTEGE